MKISAILLLIFFVSCTSKNKDANIDLNTQTTEAIQVNLFDDTSASETTLPVLDLQKKYPQKTVNLQDIANVEYIVLETHDEGLVSSNYNTTITDSLIITCNRNDEICIFHRDGKFSHSFKHKGGSGEEYSSLYEVRTSQQLNEIYIYDLIRRNIQVYDYSGEYKRTLKLYDKGIMLGHIFNLDNEHLLVEDTRNVDDEHKKETNPYPYYKISVKDGTMTQIPLKIGFRIRDSFRWNDGDLFGKISLMLSPIAYINDELIIADYALDTVYAYRNEKLSPIAVRENQRTNEFPLITTLEIITDKYYIWHSAEKKLKKDMEKMIIPEKTFLQERSTGKCSQVKLTDENITDKEYEFKRCISANNFTVPKNHALQYYPADKLIELNEAGKLQGELKEIVSRLTFDDNPVLMLAKFK